MNSQKEQAISRTERGVHRHELTWHLGKTEPSGSLIPREVSLFIKVFEVWFERYPG